MMLLACKSIYPNKIIIFLKRIDAFKNKIVLVVFLLARSRCTQVCHRTELDVLGTQACHRTAISNIQHTQASHSTEGYPGLPQD